MFDDISTGIHSNKLLQPEMGTLASKINKDKALKIMLFPLSLLNIVKQYQTSLTCLLGTLPFTDKCCRITHRILTWWLRLAAEDQEDIGNTDRDTEETRGDLPTYNNN